MRPAMAAAEYALRIKELAPDVIRSIQPGRADAPARACGVGWT
jgi:hypothetical protein